MLHVLCLFDVTAFLYLCFYVRLVMHLQRPGVQINFTCVQFKLLIKLTLGNVLTSIKLPFPLYWKK